MIIIKDQITLLFSIGPVSDFVDEEDFKSMAIIKNAGGVRPLINLSFEVKNDNIVPYLNKGNLITIMYGVSEPVDGPLIFEIESIDTAKQYRAGSVVNLMGSMYKPGFTNYMRSHNYGNIKGFECIQKIAEQNNFKFITNVTRSNDKQLWVQSGMTDWQYLSHVFWRTYKDTDTFFAFAFDNENLYYYNVRELLQAGPRWVLSVPNIANDTANGKIVNIGSYKADDSCLGQLTELAGKNQQTIAYNVDTGLFSTPESKLKTFTTMGTNKLNTREDGCRDFTYAIMTGDDHENCIAAINQNRRNNLLYSTHKLYVPVPVQYRNFRLLDPVQVIPADPDASEAGMYFITGIVNQYQGQKYQTNLILNRESANNIKGDLVTGG